MHILTILGSARKRGNTATVLQLFEEQAAGRHKIERINITGYDVRGCLGCDHCQRRSDGPNCSQKDDAPRLLERILQADLVVYASPVYAWGFSAQLKALMDRHYCLVKWDDENHSRSLAAGKRMMLLVTCGGSAEENTDLIFEAFRREVAYLKCEAAGLYAVPNCSSPRHLGQQAVDTAQAMLNSVNLLEG